MSEAKHYQSNKLFIPVPTISELVEHFKTCVENDDFYFTSSPDKKIVGYAASIEDKLLYKAAFELEKENYKVEVSLQSSAYGVFKSIDLLT